MLFIIGSLLVLMFPSDFLNVSSGWGRSCSVRSFLISGSEMEGACRECRSWEEEIYWTHFHSIHFCQFLHGDDFHQQLVSPPPPPFTPSYLWQEKRGDKKSLFFETSLENEAGDFCHELILFDSGPCWV